MDIANPVSRRIDSVSFSFYTADEIRKLSVKQITNSVIFDALNNPTKGGLYDNAMGPTDRNGVCGSCNLSYFQCPGHFGHIELAAPCYNPITFKLMYKLLGSLCLYCHQFRMSRGQIHHFAAKFRLIRAGLLVDATDLDTYLASKFSRSSLIPKKKAKSDEDLMDDEAMEVDEDSEEEEAVDIEENIDFVHSPEEYIQRIDEYVEKAFAAQKVSGITEVKTTQITEALRRLERSFLRSIPPNACSNCSGQSPKFRKEGMHKIFQRSLNAKQIRQMKAKGLEFERLNIHATAEFSKTTEEPVTVITENGTVAVQSGGATVEEDASDQKARYLTPMEVKEHIVRLWSKEKDFLDLMFGHPKSNRRPTADQSYRKSSPDIFFLEVVAVPPNRFRPLSKMNDKLFEHSQNIYLSEVLKSNQLIADLYREHNERLKNDPQSTSTADMMSRIVNSCINLQVGVVNFLDSSGAPLMKGKQAPPGIRQLLEKKEGLFRKHMMGKRVNYAARSVISPDPNIETNEIGVPPVFATKLTYPEPVTSHNIELMRAAVINGPDKWPGATHVQNEDGTLLNLGMFDEAGRTAIASQLLTPDTSLNQRTKNVNKKVYRHLKNGDFLLLNRQPTLHKPSIMAHTAKVLPGEKTIRMHYANCNTYNADFDGDEMNIHFPQNPLGRAEAMLIARTDLQYLVPTDGGVLRGLIQDHVCAGVHMSSRDTFFTHQEYMQLLYIALKPDGFGSNAFGADGNIEDQVTIGIDGKIVTLEPTMHKPKPMWSGKQVISTVLLNLTYYLNPLNLISKTRVPVKVWGPTGTEEGTVLFMDGQFLTGVLDKNQFGASAHGLVHAVYEIYGPPFAGKLLSIFGRLFTAYLQFRGFTCRMDDLTLTPQGDKERRTLIDRAMNMGLEVCMDYTGLQKVSNSMNEKDIKKALNVRLETVLRSDEKMAGLDGAMKTKTNAVTSSIISRCIPEFLTKSFPKNNMQLMTLSGAKGSAVNVSQISCLLGQQELEGRRVPTMISGKTLPCFLPFDTSAKAGGFISGRFLTGIKPSEYFFHCMAGREGLIDTAVKTSRSGYLQRCLIKHLEGLKVNYDNTVRDSDGSVIQFHYGEDGLDVMKRKTLDKFDFCAMNFKTLAHRFRPQDVEGHLDVESVDKYRKKQRKALKRGEEIPEKYRDVVLSRFSPARFLGAVSEKFYQDLANYVEKNPMKLLTTKEGASGWSGKGLGSKDFQILMYLKYQRSLVDPGEAVGLLAAQSIGEPSTQMTLNTFHFAGFGAKNVTLGIPRLREIIMTASDHIKTPMMTLPCTKETSKEHAEQVAKFMTKLLLSDIVDQVEVSETFLPMQSETFIRNKRYRIKIKFWPKALYEREYQITLKDIASTLEYRFVNILEMMILRELKNRIRPGEVTTEENIGVGVNASRFDESRPSKSTDEDEEDKGVTKEVSSDDEDPLSDAEGDGDATDIKNTRNKIQAATYDGPDDEDEDILKTMDQDDDEEVSDKTPVEDELLDKPVKSLPIKADLSQRIVSSTKYITSFTHDEKEGSWCEFEMDFPAETKKLLMIPIVENACKRSIVREIKGITRAFVSPGESENDTSLNLGTEGVNLQGMWDPLVHDGIVDVHRIGSNDISAILKTYGVEAARAAIVKEVAGVFAVYGISVDPRHLGLIADYMTFEGGYKAFNRIGMNSNPSPFAQMSFETTTSFLTTATLSGDLDTLASPSARIVMGQVVEGGTGCMQILHPLTH